MIGLAGLAERLRRRKRLAAYRKQRAAYEALSAVDLADIGLRRYQLGHAARLKVLR
ncbi:MAG: DUF1127 domain-containing protein [Alphaproteobacteria bacterium]|nr:DUF1127 domain-containing protein [Alphaproteobacteria bacterium]